MHLINYLYQTNEFPAFFLICYVLGNWSDLLMTAKAVGVDWGHSKHGGHVQQQAT